MTGGICGIRSMNGRYAPYWNAFLFKGVKGLSLKSKTPITGCAGKPYNENTISVPSLSYFIIQVYDSRGYLKVQVPFTKITYCAKIHERATVAYDTGMTQSVSRERKPYISSVMKLTLHS